MKTSERTCNEDRLSATGIEQALERVVLKGDVPDESRIFYRWLEEQWQSSGAQTVEPAGFLMDELSDRGSRIKGLASNIHELRAENEQLQEAVAVLNRHLEELMVDLVRYEGEPEPPPPKAPRGYRQVREADLEHILDEIQEAVDHAHLAERERAETVEHYRAVFAQKENQVRRLEHKLAEQNRRVSELEARLSSWPHAQAARLHRFLKRSR